MVYLWYNSLCEKAFLYAVGVSPVFLLYTFTKCCALEKDSSAAISLIVIFVSTSRILAVSILRFRISCFRAVSYTHLDVYKRQPLGGAGHIDIGIAKEREKIAFLKMQSTYILDTSKMLTRELRLELEKIFVEWKECKNLYSTVMSFGFKYGIPQDADLVFDVRFLPNPYYRCV